MKCTNCELQLTEGDKFCTNCGTEAHREKESYEKPNESNLIATSNRKQFSTIVFVILTLLCTMLTSVLFSELLLGTMLLQTTIAESFAASGLGFFFAKLITKNKQKTWVELLSFQIINIVAGQLSVAFTHVDASDGSQRAMYTLGISFAASLILFLFNKRNSSENHSDNK